MGGLAGLCTPSLQVRDGKPRVRCQAEVQA